MTIRKRTTVVPLLILFLAVGCAKTIQSYPLPDQKLSVGAAGQSRIYMILPPQVVGVGLIDMIIDGDSYIGMLGSGSYLCWEREPARQTIIVTPTLMSFSPTKELKRYELDTEANQIYYLQLHRGPLNYRNVERLNPEKGTKLLAKCKPPTIDK